MHAAGNTRRDGTRDGPLRAESWRQAIDLFCNLHRHRTRAYSSDVRRRGEALGR